MDEEGKERIRFTRLKTVCTKALQESIRKSLDIEQIKKCYPTLASHEEGLKSLEIARSQIIDFWLNNSLKEFDLIFKERDVESKLNGLDDIIQLAKARSLDKNYQPMDISKLTPKDIIDANMNCRRLQTIKSLRLIYDQLTIENTNLLHELKLLGKQSHDIKNNIVNHVSTLNKELEVLKDNNADTRINELLDSIVDEL